MNKIPTIKDTLNSLPKVQTNYIKISEYALENAIKELIKLHVQAALEVVSRRGEIEIINDYERVLEKAPQLRLKHNITQPQYCRLNKDSILNAYPLTNIK